MTACVSGMAKAFVRILSHIDTARMNDAGHVLTQARPDSADGWVLLGVAAMQNGDRAEAVRLLSEANKREPNKKLPKQLLATASNVAIARATP